MIFAEGSAFWAKCLVLLFGREASISLSDIANNTFNTQRALMM